MDRTQRRQRFGAKVQRQAVAKRAGAPTARAGRPPHRGLCDADIDRIFEEKHGAAERSYYNQELNLPIRSTLSGNTSSVHWKNHA